ncbi:radical SAM family heme chaperone HemW [Emergencia sp.]|uniref:radical SAM family heme chaperone HemW n=1 Tax=Emergencia sp. TaxID=1926557 RepID=UPI003AEF768B
MKPLGIYIHIPFCLSKCSYCGFYSRGGAAAAEQESYIQSLINDIKMYSSLYGSRYLVDTIFIGGGTPSILDPGLIGQVLDALRAHFDITEDAEITIESNPKTLTEEKLRAYRRLGINRLSIGLQSFDENCLRRLGRVHTAQDFADNFQMARTCGFDNINVDLMFAIPGHTMEIWEDTLGRAIDLAPEHISFYSLQIEEGTPFYDMFMAGEFDQIPDDVDREMYHIAIRRFKEAGYEHYEISNCAKPGRQCRHNLKYWSMEDYLGIGSGASSYVDGIRFTQPPLSFFHENGLADDTAEFVFTGLRKTSGINLDAFKERYGRAFWNIFADRRSALSQYFESGQLVEEDGILRLTEEGFDISNAIMAVFV